MSGSGSYSIDDLIAMRFANAKAFGLSTIASVLQADVAAHNAIVNDMLSDLCEIGADARRLYGGSNASNMVEVDPFGRAPTQKAVNGAEVAFPMKLFQYPMGWTAKYLENATVADLAQKTLDAEKAHMKEIQRQIKKAVFANANYAFSDFLVDNIVLNVKRFVNADSAPIQDGPNGETFDGATHTHFTAAAALVVANLTALINTVLEHGHGGHIVLAINSAQEATVRAMAGFTAYLDPRIVYGAATTGVPGIKLDIARLDNRAIGILGGSEVWVKSWCPAGYQFAYDAADSRKPLYLRQRNSAGLQGLRIAAEYDSHPLQAQFAEAEFGVGVWTRTNGAVNDVAAAWADATIT